MTPDGVSDALENAPLDCKFCKGSADDVDPLIDDHKLRWKHYTVSDLNELSPRGFECFYCSMTVKKHYSGDVVILNGKSILHTSKSYRDETTNCHHNLDVITLGP